MPILITINKAATKKMQSGHPWIYTDWINAQSLLVTAETGDVAHVLSPKGKFLGSGLVDPASKIVIRIFSTEKIDAIDQALFATSFKRCLKKRLKNFGPTEKYFRLVNSEGDNLSGLVIDCFGETLSLQFTTPAMLKFKAEIIAALNELFGSPKLIIRTPQSKKAEIIGTIPQACEIYENGITYFANLSEGQKTGWYFDQRENRKLVAGLAAQKTVLDAFCYNGGFGLLCAQQNAKSVTFVDSSTQAIEFAKQGYQHNGFKASAEFINADVLKTMSTFTQENRTFDLVILDPPPFIKSKIHKPAALVAYQKLAQAGLNLIKSGGLLFFSTCSHHMKVRDLKMQLTSAARTLDLEIVFKAITAHAKDHPVHPHMPEGQYLNSVLVQLV